jgi:hypothetical protein
VALEVDGGFVLEGGEEGEVEGQGVGEEGWGGDEAREGVVGGGGVLLCVRSWDCTFSFRAITYVRSPLVPTRAVDG